MNYRRAPAPPIKHCAECGDPGSYTDNIIHCDGTEQFCSCHESGARQIGTGGVMAEQETLHQVVSRLRDSYTVEIAEDLGSLPELLEAAIRQGIVWAYRDALAAMVGGHRFEVIRELERKAEEVSRFNVK